MRVCSLIRNVETIRDWRGSSRLECVVRGRGRGGCGNRLWGRTLFLREEVSCGWAGGQLSDFKCMVELSKTCRWEYRLLKLARWSGELKAGCF